MDDLRSYLPHALPQATKIAFALIVICTILVQIHFAACDWLCLLAGYLMPPVCYTLVLIIFIYINIIEQLLLILKQLF
jgi:hypothetical protein